MGKRGEFTRWPQRRLGCAGLLQNGSHILLSLESSRRIAAKQELPDGDEERVECAIHFAITQHIPNDAAVTLGIYIKFVCIWMKLPMSAPCGWFGGWESNESEGGGESLSNFCSHGDFSFPLPPLLSLALPHSKSDLGAAIWVKAL